MDDHNEKERGLPEMSFHEYLLQDLKREKVMKEDEDNQDMG
jgi:hypothetical protein